jgi:hypothetical protein
MLTLTACSAPDAGSNKGASVADPSEPAVQPAAQEKPRSSDPFLDKLDRFEAAYAELVCKANQDVDPTSSVSTLRCPYERLEQIAPEKSFTLDAYLRILAKHGFNSADEYFKTQAYIHKARPGWFESLKSRLYELVEQCPKK